MKAFLAAAEEACGKCASDPAAVAEAAAKLEIKFPAAAIPGCAIRYVGALEAKEQVEKTAAVDLSQFGGEVPVDDFYYGAK